ncbi:hypothetical protein KIL84_007737 [Mauremys mutica]|uniref:Uncharacterized protein n=1 Tax=Mauremys mutica TaxID=74926 RepID=A0A9D3WY01_9SAUR|nr:hypothetical protein KIL84_007737 [Mauremys mutica]
MLAEFVSLEIEIKLSKLKLKPQDEILKQIFGWGKQCPICKVPCEVGGTNHKEHFTLIHWPQGLRGGGDRISPLTSSLILYVPIIWFPVAGSRLPLQDGNLLFIKMIISPISQSPGEK